MQKATTIITKVSAAKRFVIYINTPQKAQRAGSNPTLRFSCSPTQLSKEARSWRVRCKRLLYFGFTIKHGFALDHFDCRSISRNDFDIIVSAKNQVVANCPSTCKHIDTAVV